MLAVMPILELSTEIAAPIDQVFAFHLDTRNAAAISPSDVEVVSVEGTFPLVEGAEVRLRVRQKPWPIAQTWRVRIERIVEPVAVIDLMLSGPFAEWRHEHLFDDLGGGRTRMTDRVAYRPPLGPLGALAERLFLRRLLVRSFQIRQERTRALLEGADRAGPSTDR